jgi:hypothetical protein
MGCLLSCLPLAVSGPRGSDCPRLRPARACETGEPKQLRGVLPFAGRELGIPDP